MTKDQSYYKINGENHKYSKISFKLKESVSKQDL